VIGCGCRAGRFVGQGTRLRLGRGGGRVRRVGRPPPGSGHGGIRGVGSPQHRIRRDSGPWLDRSDSLVRRARRSHGFGGTRHGRSGIGGSRAGVGISGGGGEWRTVFGVGVKIRHRRLRIGGTSTRAPHPRRARATHGRHATRHAGSSPTFLRLPDQPRPSGSTRVTVHSRSPARVLRSPGLRAPDDRLLSLSVRRRPSSTSAHYCRCIPSDTYDRNR
jgi:hypothetical protein